VTQSIDLFTLISYLWIGLGDSSEANWLVPGHQLNSLKLTNAAYWPNSAAQENLLLGHNGK